MKLQHRKRDRRATLALAILICGALTPIRLIAEDAQWTGLLTQGQQLQARGRYSEAAASFQAAVDHAAASAQPLEIAQSLYQLALVKQVLGEYSSATSLYEKATALCERNPAPKLMAAILLNHARLNGLEGNFEAAAVLAEKSLELHRAELGPTHPSVADTL